MGAGKKITYHGILPNLRQIAAIMALTIKDCSVGGVCGIVIPGEIWNVLWHPSEQTEKQVPSAILELAELLRKYSYDSRYVRKEAWFSDEWAIAEKRRRVVF